MIPFLHTAASDSEDFGPALADALPPSGQEARPSAAYSELGDVLSRTTEKLTLDWPDEPRESRASKLDEQFLSGAHSKPERRKVPFLGDLHREISSSWKQPFSSHLTNAAAADFTNLVGSVELGYTAMPVIEDTLASHLSPSLAPSWKSRPLLPSKPCRTTSALIGKSYIAAGQAGMALHTMAILQAYQADVLKEMDEGTGLTPEAVKELRRATDLALRATKHTARAVGRSMAASVAAERHLWLNLLSTPFNVAGPRFSPERGENGCDTPSPYDHDGRINDRLGRGLRRQTGERGVEGRVPLLAHKLPGTQGCLPGFEVFSPRSRGVSYHSQDGQYGDCVPHKPSRRFTVAHPGQACAPSSP